MKFYTDSSWSNPTPVPFMSRCNFTRTHHEATLHRFLLCLGAVLHGLIIKQPYTGSFVSRWSFILTHHETTLHRFLLPKMQFYTDSSSGNPTQVPSFQDVVLHGLIIRQPYTGSFFPRWSFTRSHHQATLHRFLLPSKMKFYTDSSPDNPTPVPPQFKDEVLHELISQ